MSSGPNMLTKHYRFDSLHPPLRPINTTTIWALMKALVALRLPRVHPITNVANYLDTTLIANELNEPFTKYLLNRKMLQWFPIKTLNQIKSRA